MLKNTIKRDKMDYGIYDPPSSEDSFYECFSESTTDISTTLHAKAQLLEFIKQIKGTAIEHNVYHL